jgi:hypothetical protein
MSTNLQIDTATVVRVADASIRALLDLADHAGCSQGAAVGETLAKLAGLLVQHGVSPDAVRRFVEDGIAKGQGTWQ